MFRSEARSFRSLVVLAGLSLAGGVYFSLNAPPPPSELQELYGWHGYGAVIPGWFDARLWQAWMVFSVAGLAGSFFFWRPARWLLLLPLCMAPVRAGLGGIYVSHPVEDAFWSVYFVFSTFVIGMALFSEEVRARFSSGRCASG